MIYCRSRHARGLLTTLLRSRDSLDVARWQRHPTEHREQPLHAFARLHASETMPCSPAKAAARGIRTHHRAEGVAVELPGRGSCGRCGRRGPVGLGRDWGSTRPIKD